MTNQLNKYHLFDAINSCTCQGSLDRNGYEKTLAGPVAILNKFDWFFCAKTILAKTEWEQNEIEQSFLTNEVKGFHSITDEYIIYTIQIFQQQFLIRQNRFGNVSLCELFYFNFYASANFSFLLLWQISYLHLPFTFVIFLDKKRNGLKVSIYRSKGAMFWLYVIPITILNLVETTGFFSVAFTELILNGWEQIVVDSKLYILG